MGHSVWLAIVTVAALMFASGVHAADKNLHALLQVYNYGWNVEIKINDSLIYTKGRHGAGTTQLFGVNDPIKAKLGEAARNLLCLVPGSNVAEVSYTAKEGDTEADSEFRDDLEVKISEASINADGKHLELGAVLFEKTIKVRTAGGKFRDKFRLMQADVPLTTR